ncbi:MAG: hypothetical protein AAF581_13115 [Planctomycetota bacterium]
MTEVGFEHRQYLIRRKVLTILGAKFHIYDSDGNVVLFSKQKAFKLKEDIRVYTDDTMAEERLMIRARSIIDFSAAYDVVDSVSQRKIGALRRQGMKSFVRDSWQILDADDNLIAPLEEDSTAMALVRRFLANLIPQKFHVDVGGKPAVRYAQRFNPFIFKMDVSLDSASDGVIDPLLALAAGILLVAIEGRQDG